MMQLTNIDVSVLAQIAEQWETITDERLGPLIAEMSGDGARIAAALAGRTNDSDVQVQATIDGLKLWAKQNRRDATV